MERIEKVDGWTVVPKLAQRERGDAGSERENFPKNGVYSKFGMAGHRNGGCDVWTKPESQRSLMCSRALEIRVEVTPS